MNTMYWNVRGIGSLRAIRKLRFILKQNAPQIVFLMETKVDNKRMTMIRSHIVLLMVSRYLQRGGGLCLAWKDSVNVSLHSFSKNHIDVMIKNDYGNE